MQRTFKNELINDLFIDKKEKEKRMKMNRFLSLMEEIIIENQVEIEAEQKKAS